jgi:uncharacterized protein
MRRKDKEITDKSVIHTILEDAMVCRLGLASRNQPYIVPMNFVFESDHLFLHSGLSGKKIDVMRENSSVCFEIESQVSLNKTDNACSTGMNYYSIIGYGDVSFIEDKVEKKRVLNLIAFKYSGSSDAQFPDEVVEKTLIIRIDIKEMSGKASGL